MVKKKFLAILCLILSLVIVFAGCTPSDNGKDDEGPGEVADGFRRLTVYYHNDTGYADKDIWMWYGSVDGAAYVFKSCDYGGYVYLDMPEDIEQVGFIVRTGCVPGSPAWADGVGKDGTDSDRFITLDGKYTEIYLKANDANSYTSTDGGVTLEILRYLALADMTDLNHIKVTVSDGSKLDAADVSLTDSNNDFVPMTVSNNIITTNSALDLSETYTVKVTGFDPVGVVPSTYFSSEDFEENYTYDGKLGVELTESSTIFRLWAPTASKVELNIYDFGLLGKADDPIALTRKEKGLWETTVDENLNGKYYTYTVTTSMGTNEAVDPYAVSAGVNGTRGMILDLDSTDPAGWTNTPFVPSMAVNGTANYTDAEIWEIHVRDFSNNIKDSQYKGKFLAFTETGLKNSAGLPVGVDYLKELGITHVHLLPSFDYASVDESRGGFNWGYDPQNYNVPEGSYSTDPTDGAKRVNEFKQMVQALHNQGIGVIMDVVYNHTYSADSNFNKIVPYYYYRYDANGALSNGSGCGNETATERSMVRKFLVDSVTYWQNEYNVDGFRFDLMGLHDTTTMQAIESAVHATNPNALLYGEGWTGGTTTNTYTGALLANLQATNKGTGSDGKGTNGIAMFNDVIRDAVKGSVFNVADTGFATGARKDYLGKVLFGAAGSVNDTSFTGLSGADVSWTAANPTQVINYVSAHDNNTLYDRLLTVYGENDALNFNRNALSAAIVQTSLGIPFMQAGEEMLRSKKNEDGTYNENSYNASDAVNNLDWESLTATSNQYKMMQYYKGLIEFRKSCETLRMISSLNTTGIRPVSVCSIDKKDGAFVAFTVTNPESGEKLLIIYNAEEKDVNYTLPAGNWNLYVNGTTAGATAISTGLSGAQTISKVSCYVYKAA